jgi:hypothetical protein
MPISELDLRVIIREVSNSITNFKQINANAEILGIALSGINSAHPLIDDLLSTGINLPVRILRPIGASCVQSVSFKQLIVHQSIGRIIGLGLGLLPHESLISCSITEKADHHSFEAITERDWVAEPIQAEEQEEVEDLKQEEVELPTLELMLTKEETKLAQIEENTPEEEWPSIKNIAPKEIEETKITKAIAEKEEEWPSLGLSFAKEEAEEQETKAEQKEEKQTEAEESMPEDEWPSLNLTFASEGEDDNNK